VRQFHNVLHLLFFNLITSLNYLHFYKSRDNHHYPYSKYENITISCFEGHNNAPSNHTKTENFIELYPRKKCILWSTKNGRPNIHTNIAETVVIFGLEEIENLTICSTYTWYFPPYTSQQGSVYIYLTTLNKQLTGLSTIHRKLFHTLLHTGIIVRLEAKINLE
jgi:hypothetical protein